MILSHSLSVFSLALQMGFKQAIRNWLVLLGGFLTFAAIMLIYGGVIHMIPQVDIAHFHITQAQMIWYLGTTELVLFCTPSFSYSELQMDIKNGQIHLAAIRPVSSALVRVSFWVGDSLARLCVYFLPYLIYMTFLSGTFAFSLIHLIGFLASFPVAMTLALCGWYFIGASCLWIGEAAPLYWVWQKLIFVLGAILWPVFFYPAWLQTISWVSPFHGYLTVAGNWVLDLDVETYAFGFLHQICWGTFFLLLLRWYDRIILRHIQQTGA